jgi:hypothetical protein
VTNVEVSVGLGRKASVNPASVFVRLQVLCDDRLDEIGGRGEINARHGMDTPLKKFKRESQNIEERITKAKGKERALKLII